MCRDKIVGMVACGNAGVHLLGKGAFVRGVALFGGIGKLDAKTLLDRLIAVINGVVDKIARLVFGIELLVLTVGPVEYREFLAVVIQRGVEIVVVEIAVDVGVFRHCNIGHLSCGGGGRVSVGCSRSGALAALGLTTGYGGGKHQAGQ